MQHDLLNYFQMDCYFLVQMMMMADQVPAKKIDVPKKKKREAKLYHRFALLLILFSFYKIWAIAYRHALVYNQ